MDKIIKGLKYIFTGFQFLSSKKSTTKKGLLYHGYRFGLFGNIKVWFCRSFGHEINEDVNHQWCNRCGLFYGEIYSNQHYNQYKNFKNVEMENNYIQQTANDYDMTYDEVYNIYTKCDCEMSFYEQLEEYIFNRRD